MRHTAHPDGTIVSVDAEILLDGGAYRSSSYHVTANAACFAAGPYRVPNAHVHATAVRTNNPPCGAMRGFGVVQVCFAHEAQMDKLAAVCLLDPVEIRLRNAIGPGDELLTGQRVEGSLPVAEVIRACAALPLPDTPAADPIMLPGGAGRTADVADVTRGVGFAVGFKNLMYAEGYMDGSEARVRIERRRGDDHMCRRGSGAGIRDPGAADRPYGARRRRRGGGTSRHVDRFGRVDLGEPPDDDVGRRGGAAPAVVRAMSSSAAPPVGRSMRCSSRSSRASTWSTSPRCSIIG